MWSVGPIAVELDINDDDSDGNHYINDDINAEISLDKIDGILFLSVKECFSLEIHQEHQFGLEVMSS